MLWVAIVGAAIGIIVVVAFATPIRFAISAIGGAPPNGPSDAELERAWLENGLAGLVIVPGLGSGTFELLERYDIFGVIDAAEGGTATADSGGGAQVPGAAALDDSSPSASGQVASSDPANPQPSLPGVVLPPGPSSGPPSPTPSLAPSDPPAPTPTPEPTREPTPAPTEPPPTPDPTREPPPPTPEPDRPECSNGDDDDGDGLTDYGILIFGDPDCSSPGDDSESS
jgi:hypothetical protein